MGLKLRASYILLAISIVILAIGIILIVNHPAPDETTEPPAITTLVDRTVVVLTYGEERFDFDIPRTGVLRVTIEVISGGIIDISLYKNSELWWNGEEGWDIIRSSFKVPIDAGQYYLIVEPETAPWSGGTSGERTVSVYLEFEG
jgi:hypothetical protein